MVNDEIAKFIASSEAEVLCIRGKWGVGKTFTWSKQLEAAQAKGTIGRYAEATGSKFQVWLSAA